MLNNSKYEPSRTAGPFRKPYNYLQCLDTAVGTGNLFHNHLHPDSIQPSLYGIVPYVQEFIPRRTVKSTFLKACDMFLRLSDWLRPSLSLLNPTLRTRCRTDRRLHHYDGETPNHHREEHRQERQVLSVQHPTSNPKPRRRISSRHHRHIPNYGGDNIGLGQPHRVCYPFSSSCLTPCLLASYTSGVGGWYCFKQRSSQSVYSFTSSYSAGSCRSSSEFVHPATPKFGECLAWGVLTCSTTPTRFSLRQHFESCRWSANPLWSWDRQGDSLGSWT